MNSMIKKLASMVFFVTHCQAMTPQASLDSMPSLIRDKIFNYLQKDDFLNVKLLNKDWCTKTRNWIFLEKTPYHYTAMLDENWEETLNKWRELKVSKYIFVIDAADKNVRTYLPLLLKSEKEYYHHVKFKPYSCIYQLQNIMRKNFLNTFSDEIMKNPLLTSVELILEKKEFSLHKNEIDPFFHITETPIHVIEYDENEILNMIKENKRISTLDFTEHKGYIKVNENIYELKGKKRTITDLVEALQNNNMLKTLIVNTNKTGPLLEALQSNHSIKTLRLSRLRDEDHVFLTELFQKNGTLEKLIIDSGNMEPLLQALHDNHSIKILKLRELNGQNRIFLEEDLIFPEKDPIFLTEFLQKNTFLQKLDLSYCNLKWKDLECISNGLQDKTIESLAFKKNKIFLSKEGVEWLLTMLEDRKVSKVLDVRENNFHFKDYMRIKERASKKRVELLIDEQEDDIIDKFPSKRLKEFMYL